jgi:hypothetical protein
MVLWVSFYFDEAKLNLIPGMGWTGKTHKSTVRFKNFALLIEVISGIVFALELMSAVETQLYILRQGIAGRISM